MRVARILLFFFGACLLAFGWFGRGRHASGVPFLIGGVVLIVGSLLEHGQYRDRPSDTQPLVEPDEEDTNEVFFDPTTGRPMRVFYNRRTGERRYVE